MKDERRNDWEKGPGCRQRLICVPKWLALSLLSLAELLSWERVMYEAVSRVKGRRRRGEVGGGGRRLALGLFAALPFPLAALAHLHFRQLDVPQHVGVWDHMDTQQKASLLQPPTPAETFLRLGLTCRLAVLGVAQVAQGTFVIAQVIEGDACSVHGLEVVSLVAQHLQTVLLHSLVVDQLRLQQARWKDNQTCSRIKRSTKDKREEIPICILTERVNLVAAELPRGGLESTVSSR